MTTNQTATQRTPLKEVLRTLEYTRNALVGQLGPQKPCGVRCEHWVCDAVRRADAVLDSFEENY